MNIVGLVKQSNVYSIQKKAALDQTDIDDIIFMIAGPDENIIHVALQKILVATSDIDSGVVKHEQLGSDPYYVYGYFEEGQPPSWQTAFYIGKGKGLRLFAHLDQRVRLRANTDRAMVTRQKDLMIDQWLDANPGKLLTRIIAREHAFETLINRLYSGLTELEAFYLEKYLIMRARRPQNISNDTAGNHAFGKYTSVCQPREYNRTNGAHELLWRQAVEGFLDSPQSSRMANTLRPSLVFIGLEPELDALSESLSSIDLKPCDMSHAPENRLTAESMIRKFCGVHGAGDAKASFMLSDEYRPYRFDLRIPPAGLEVSITLRPIECTSSGNRAFR